MPAVARPLRQGRATAGATHCATERPFCRAVAISILLSRSRRWRRHSSMFATDARAQSPAASPFQPSLTDPRNVQRFKSPDDPIDARDPGGRSCRRRAPAKPASIPPARSARKRKQRRSPASRIRCRRRRRRCPGRRRPPAVTPARRRSRRARPTPRPTSRRTRRCGGRRRRCRMPSSRSACASAAFC